MNQGARPVLCGILERLVREEIIHLSSTLNNEGETGQTLALKHARRSKGFSWFPLNHCPQCGMKIEYSADLNAKSACPMKFEDDATPDEKAKIARVAGQSELDDIIGGRC
jgi:hypothetical protein